MTDRSVLVRLRANVSQFVAQTKLAEAAVKSLHNEIDKTNDRTAWLAQGVLALAPAVTTLGAGAVPVISGLATQLTLTAAAAVTMGLAFNGVGDALGALNEYQLDPSVANLEKLNEAMAKIGPEGAEFVQFLDSLGPAFSELANSARGPMFAGMTDGLRDFMDLMPQLNVVVSEIADGIGILSAEAGAGLSGDRFSDFFGYLETEAKPILLDMGRTLGNFTDGLLAMMVAFGPVTEDFSEGLLGMSRSFADWSHNLDDNAGFQEFLDYVREAGPQALDFFGSLIMALVELAEAAAPVGTVMLPMLTGLLDVIADLANTPLGPVVIGFTALTSAWGRLNALAAITGSGVMSKATKGIRDNYRASREAVPSLGQLGTAFYRVGQSAENQTAKTKAAMGAVRGFTRTAGPLAAQAGLMAFAMSDLDNKMGLTNTTALTLAGSLAGPWGAALGAAVGLTMDLAAANDDLAAAIDRATNTGGDGADALLAKQAALQAEFSKTLNDDSFMGNVTRIAAFISGDLNRAQDDLAILDTTIGQVEQGATGIGTLLSVGFHQGAGAIDVATQSADEFRSSLESVNAVLEGRASLRDYQAALDDFTASLKENGRTLDRDTEAGRANEAALDRIASSALKAAESLSGMNRVRYLRQARADFLDAAEKLGMGEQKAKDLARELGLLNLKRAVPQIIIDSREAQERIRIINTQLDQIDRFIPVNIHVSRTGASGDLPFLSGRGAADGATVPKTGLPYADRHLYMLADGEEVVSNRFGQADKNRAELKAASKYGAKLAVVGYADGGTTGDDPATPVRLRPAIQKPSGGWDRAMARLERSLDKLSDSLDTATSAHKGWLDKMADVSQATVAGFNTGLFDRDANMWAPGAGGGPLTNLDRDIAGLGERERLQSQLLKAGLSSEAFAAVLGQGKNADLAGILARGEAAQIQAKFDQRSALQARVGAAAGFGAFGAQEADAAVEMRLATAAVERIEGLMRESERDRKLFEKEREKERDRRIGAAAAEGVKKGGNHVARRNRRDN